MDCLPGGHLSRCLLADQHCAMTSEIENVRVGKVHKPIVQAGSLLQLNTHISVSLTCPTPLNVER